jgi:hypothetical protein
MNKYVIIEGSSTPQLLLESLEDVENAEMGTAVSTAHDKLTTNSLDRLADNPNDMEARTQAMNMMFLLNQDNNPFVGGALYKEAVEKYGAILVNPNGGYRPKAGAEVAKQWEAASEDSAIC